MKVKSFKPCMNFTSQFSIMSRTTKIEYSSCKKHVAPSYMYKHWQRAHEESPKLQTCTKCGKKFHEKRRLQNHTASKHPEDHILFEGEDVQMPVKSQMCDVCEKSFFTKDALNDHISRQHTQDPVRFFCFKCGKCFKNNRIFTQHITKNHKSIICVKCPTDAKKFGSKSALKKHSLTKHPEQPRTE